MRVAHSRLETGAHDRRNGRAGALFLLLLLPSCNAIFGVGEPVRREESSSSASDDDEAEDGEDAAVSDDGSDDDGAMDDDDLGVDASVDDDADDDGSGDDDGADDDDLGDDDLSDDDLSDDDLSDDDADDDTGGTDDDSVDPGLDCQSGETRSCDDGGFEGNCADGVQECGEGGVWGDCSVQPEPGDACTLGDDANCNGIQNEQCPCTTGETRACSQGGLEGPCADGEQVCDENAEWGPCDIEPEDQDSCIDGADENCNGVVNEGCSCISGEVRSCADDGALGNCAEGVKTCGDDGVFGECDVLPEDADGCTPGDDASCNGVANEGCPCADDDTRPCSQGGYLGNCAAGFQTCSAGDWGDCSIEPQNQDGCVTGDDASCDGVPNDGCTCAQGDTRPCSEGGLLGPCADGEQTCNGGVWGACTIAPASNDGCSAGNDANCNGIQNEGCPCVQGTTRPCSQGGLFGKCANGVQVCSAQAAWGACSITPSSQDTCQSGNDDDCDGTPNGGCACINGNTRPCSQAGALGVCASGTQTCSSGTWGACSVQPGTELCNSDNKDENCNGTVNENPPCQCTNGQTMGSCGECGGVNQCVNGRWSCSDTSVPEAYYLDDDGDGFGAGPAVMICPGMIPIGYVLVPGDCCDSDGLAYPGQTNYYSSTTRCGDYDFDCNEVIEERWGNWTDFGFNTECGKEQPTEPGQACINNEGYSAGAEAPGCGLTTPFSFHYCIGCDPETNTCGFDGCQPIVEYYGYTPQECR